MLERSAHNASLRPVRFVMETIALKASTRPLMAPRSDSLEGDLPCLDVRAPVSKVHNPVPTLLKVGEDPAKKDFRSSQKDPLTCTFPCLPLRFSISRVPDGLASSHPENSWLKIVQFEEGAHCFQLYFFPPCMNEEMVLVQPLPQVAFRRAELWKNTLVECFIEKKKKNFPSLWSKPLPASNGGDLASPMPRDESKLLYAIFLVTRVDQSCSEEEVVEICVEY
ncbi:hypothetical protein Nepgr_012382 [Nepenthes gracilis]|uniref:Uncharacterized protein n=1 Tax=Nepenthes gracilis TaxID=150966 RepID=A0AAD3SHF0_NEPGR|nr:hypothetical protein Nepgr_012382 [Nepenthes gracilis]